MRILIVPILCGVLLSAQHLSAADGDAAAEKEVLATLEAMAAAIIQKDAATLDRLYHEDLTYNHSTGMTQNKAQVMRAISSGSFVTMRFSEPTILVYGSVAVVQITTDLQYRPQGVLVDRHLNQLYVLVKRAQAGASWPGTRRGSSLKSLQTQTRKPVTRRGVVSVRFTLCRGSGRENVSS